jgi:L-threonylcarbamoyladenylate synthase
MTVEGTGVLDTRLIVVDRDNLNQDSLAPTARAARDGRLIAFPTDTVYGIGTNALLPEPVLDIFTAKGRPADKPLILLIADPEDVSSYVIQVNDVAGKLMKLFWPGPLTLVFKKADIVPGAVTADGDTVGVRCPGDEVTRTLIRLAGVALATTSANLAGKPGPTTAREVEENMRGRVSYIIDAGKTSLGMESTIIDVSWGEPAMIREGALPWTEIVSELET